MVYGGLSFQGTGCPVPIVYFYEMINVWNIVSSFIDLSGMFLFKDIVFVQQIGHVTIDLIHIRIVC